MTALPLTSTVLGFSLGTWQNIPLEKFRSRRTHRTELQYDEQTAFLQDSLAIVGYVGNRRS